MADELMALRASISSKEEAFALEMKEAKEKRDHVQQELMESLVGVDLKSMKVSTGETISIGTRKSYVWASTLDEMRFAQQMGCMRPDSRLVSQALGKVKEGAELPTGVEVKEVNFISIRGGKKNDEESLPKRQQYVRVNSTTLIADTRESSHSLPR